MPFPSLPPPVLPANRPPHPPGTRRTRRPSTLRSGWRPSLVTALFLGSAPIARADVPRVVADIPPVQSLVARVMQDIGEPALLMRSDASPHGYAMRPSEALALERSDIVFSASETLTPWLARRVTALAPDATSVELMALPDTLRLERREGATFSAHEHADGHEGEHENEDEDEHDDEHEREDEHENQHENEHDEEHENEHENEHGNEHGNENEHDEDGHDVEPEDGHAEDAAHDGPDAPDPHGWLDPVNAATWLDAIAETLSAADPDNAHRYAANAADGRRELETLRARTEERLAAVREKTFITFHDSYAYFEARFDVRAAGSLSPSDASDPGPTRLREVRESIEQLGVACVFSEPQFDPGRVSALVDGLPVHIGTLDPLGATLAPGPMLYEQLIDAIATTLLDCLDR